MLRHTFLAVDKSQTFLSAVGSYPQGALIGHAQKKRGGTEYIKVFYNPQRQQARFGCLPPFAYEEMFYKGRL